MNTPHIGQTLHQRALLRLHLEREHAAELARFEATHAALQVDALLDRVSQPEPVQMCAVEEDEEVVPAWLVMLGAALWLAVLGLGLGWNLHVVQLFVHALRNLP